MYNIHDSTVYLYFFIILANKVACLLHCYHLLSAFAKRSFAKFIWSCCWYSGEVICPITSTKDRPTTFCRSTSCAHFGSRGYTASYLTDVEDNQDCKSSANTLIPLRLQSTTWAWILTTAGTVSTGSYLAISTTLQVFSWGHSCNHIDLRIKKTLKHVLYQIWKTWKTF